MTAYPDKLDVEQVFQQLTPAADPPPHRPRAADVPPGPWRVVSEDGSTSALRPAEHAESSCGSPARSVPAEPLQRRLRPCELAPVLGPPAGNACSRATPAELRLPNPPAVRLAAELETSGACEPSNARTQISMPRPMSRLSDDLDASPAVDRGDLNVVSRPPCQPPETLPTIEAGGRQSVDCIGRSVQSGQRAGLGGSGQTPMWACPWAFLSRDEVDPDLVRIVDAWPRLDRQIRQAILIIFDALTPD